MAQMKQHFYKDAVTLGIGDIRSLGNLRVLYPMGCAVKKPTLEKWLDRLHRVPRLSQMPEMRRLVNHFKLGADPEFVFGQCADRDYPPGRVNADELGLKQGQAYGADNNGRLVEVRPYPSRSALDVVASLLSTMRWMAVMHPKVAKFHWISGAYQFQDGLGGHVHFGRKRPTREAEISALDVLSELTLKLGLFPLREVELRRRGDAHHQVYGAPHDFRLQKHGYEYRTWPSWLDSPWLAYFTIVISKLAVYNPDLVMKMAPSVDTATNYNRVKNLLAYYKGLDEDARIAYATLVRIGLPQYRGGDFRERWGMLNVDARSGVKYIPSAIAASHEDRDELFMHLVHGKELMFRIPVPTWTPTAPPEGYHLVIANTVTSHVKGLGEMVYDLVTHVKEPIGFIDAGGGAKVLIGTPLWKQIPKAWRNEHRGMFEEYGGGASRVMIPAHMRNGSLAGVVKKLLLEVLPVWRIKDVKAGSWEEFKRKVPKVVEVPKMFRGKVTYHRLVA